MNPQGAAATNAQAFDSIDGGAGTDTVKWYATATENANIVGTYSNIEVAKFYGAENIGTIDSTLIGGSKEIWLETAGAAVTVNGLSGKTLGVSGKTTGTQTGNFGTAASAALALSSASDAAGTGNAAVDIAGSATTLAVSGSGLATLTDNGGAGDTLKTLTVSATGATTLNVTGLGALTSIDGSASTANVTLTGIAASAATVKTGAGKDTFTVTATAKATVDSGAGDDTVTLGSSLASTSSVNLGDGNDKLLAGAGAINSGNVIDGGAGTDTIAASLINAANAAVIKNFENIDIGTAATLDVELMTGSTISGLTMTGDAAAAATVTNVAAGVGLTVSGANTGAKTISVKGASTNATDTFAITFAGEKVAGATATAPNITAVTGGITLNNVETVTVASGGADNTWNGLVLTGSATNTLQTLTITGEKNLNIDLTATAYGKAPASATDTTNGLKLIDGSAATGKLDIDLSAAATLNTSTSGLTVKGGSADDIITLKNSVLVASTNSQKFVVEAGAGNDKIVVAANGGSLTGGAGNDTFDVTLAVATAATEAGSVFVTIADLAAGDKIDFAANASGTFQTTKVTLGATVTNLDQALAAAIDAANEVAWFQYGGNTYVVADTDAATGSGTFGIGDTVVKITGTVDLANSTFASTVLTIA